MANILPFYLVCDESYSMLGYVDVLNDSLDELHAEISVHPVVSDKTRFGIIGFSDSAEVILPLTDLSQIESLPRLGVKGGTNYGVAFDTLFHEIGQEVENLKADGHRVFRPCVFFMSDGQPTDPEATWQAALARLVAPEHKYRPNILAFGITDAEKSVIGKVGVTGAWITDGTGMGPAPALREFATKLTQSIIASGESADVPELKIDNDIAGYTRIETDEM